MKQDLKERLQQPSALLSQIGRSGVLLGAIGYMELNVAGFPFPGWSTAAHRKALADHLLPIVRSLSKYRWIFEAEMSELSREEKLLLLERLQLSDIMAARSDGVHVLINDRQDTECYINEEEHLLIKTFFPGEAGLGSALANMSELLAEVETKLTVARSEVFGYMMSDPAKSGSAIFFSSLVHLPGLRLSKYMAQTRHALDEIGFLLEPLLMPPENEHEDVGDLYLLQAPTVMVSNLEAMVEDMKRITAGLCEQELRARSALVVSPKSAARISKSVQRAYKTLTESGSLKYRRLLSSLSMLRFGLSTGILHAEASPEEVENSISRAYTETAPAHQLYRLGIKSIRERRKLRAAYAQHLTEEQLKAAIATQMH